jgi:hypothetical protein
MAVSVETIFMLLPDRLSDFLRCENPDVSTQHHQQHPIHIFAGTALCRLLIWTDSQWMALPSEKRPSHHVYVPGLGRIAAVLVSETE